VVDKQMLSRAYQQRNNLCSQLLTGNPNWLETVQRVYITKVRDDAGPFNEDRPHNLSLEGVRVMLERTTLQPARLFSSKAKNIKPTEDQKEIANVSRAYAYMLARVDENPELSMKVS